MRNAQSQILPVAIAGSATSESQLVSSPSFRKSAMNRILWTLALFSAAFGDHPAQAQVAGSTTIAVATERLDAVAIGWSAKKQILGRTVFNENGEKVGTIDDIIVAPDKSVTVAIVSVGGWIGVRWHEVAIPVDAFTQNGVSFVLAGTTKSMIKSLPVFRYSKEARDTPPVESPSFVR
jgi:sporulation protein YlmC with PRC-barrel domain